MAALEHSINNVVVIMANFKATEVWQISYFVLSDVNCMLQEGFGLSSSPGLLRRRAGRDMILPVV